MIEARIIADSLNPQGDRLTTFIVTFPRIILAEFNTHRMFSRNSASSRAIPFEKMVKSVEENPFIPIAWQKDHKGMQGTEYLTGDFEIQEVKATWLIAKDKAIHEAKNLNRIGTTKQLCNRLLEPFMWHTVIMTSGKEGLENFFDLRDHEAAEIHIQELARKMKEVYNESTPKQLQAGEWHIPFGDKIDIDKIVDATYNINDNSIANFDAPTNTIIKISTAMNARISYTVVGGGGKEPNYEADIKLHDRLLDSKHFSPFEHIARVMSSYEYETFVKGNLHIDNAGHLLETSSNCFGWCNNFRGFIPYRYIIENDSRI
jgi:thymidylate synthase ThyX